MFARVSHQALCPARRSLLYIQMSKSGRRKAHYIQFLKKRVPLVPNGWFVCIILDAVVVKQSELRVRNTKTPLAANLVISSLNATNAAFVSSVDIISRLDMSGCKPLPQMLDGHLVPPALASTSLKRARPHSSALRMLCDKNRRSHPISASLNLRTSVKLIAVGESHLWLRWA